MSEGGSRRPVLWWATLLLGPAAFGALAFAPTALHRVPGLGSRPAHALAVVAWMAVWWFTEAVPIAWTAALPLALYPVLGVFGGGPLPDLRRTAASYVDAYVFLFLGGMAIGAAMEEWGLHRRLALALMRALGTEPRRLLLGMLVATAVVSAWISNTATAVMMVPLAAALVAQFEALRGRRLDGFATVLFLAVAYGANIGGIATKVGTPSNAIFAGWVADQLGRDVGFLGYMLVGAPFVALMLPVAWTVLWLAGRDDVRRGGLDAAQARAVLDAARAELPAAGHREKLVAACFLGAAALWVASAPVQAALAPAFARVAPGLRLQAKHYEAGVALAAMLVLLAAGCLPVRALRRVPWGTVVLIGGSFAMAAGIEGSGLTGLMAARLAEVARLPLLAQLALTSAVTVGVSAIASNTATINVMLNLVPRALPVLAAATIGSSCDFALPAGTPPNAIVFGSGRVRLATMMRVGLLLDVLAVALVALYSAAWVPLVLGP